jgi:hypothetical protein
MSCGLRTWQVLEGLSDNHYTYIWIVCYREADQNLAAPALVAMPEDVAIAVSVKRR